MAYIKENSIQRVRDAADLVAIVESYGIKLRRTGSNFVGLCPFHREKTGSFNVSAQGQFFKCFGCGAAGDALKFILLMEKCEFIEAVTILAQRVGVELEYEKNSRTADGGAAEFNPVIGESKKALYWANRIALNYFRKSLAQSPAYDYLRSRGFSVDTINAWQLGWSPDEWDGLVKFIKAELQNRGAMAKQDDAFRYGVEAGILRRHAKQDRIYDAFRGRVMFPIFDIRQQVVGFGGRVLVEKPESGGKYLNTGETPLFKKSKLLFGVNFAAREISERKEAVIVEGYTDTIMCHQFGIRNVVATLGTALTDEHLPYLRRAVGQGGRVFALFDADNAGRQATERAIKIFMRADASLWVLQNLAVKDAAEFLPKFGAEKFREFLQTAQEAFNYALHSALHRNMNLPERSAAIYQIMELVNLCPDPIKRQIMRREVARVGEVEEKLLPQPKEVVRENKRIEEIQATAQNRLASKAAGRRKLEMRLLHCMLADKNWCAQITDYYPPDDWAFFDLAETARIVRDTWEIEKPEAARLQIRATGDIQQALIDLCADAFGVTPAPSQAELRELLRKITRENLTAKKEKLHEQLRLAELNQQTAEVDRLLVELNNLARKTKKRD